MTKVVPFLDPTARLSLPMFAELTPERVSRVAAVVNVRGAQTNVG